MLVRHRRNRWKSLKGDLISSVSLLALSPFSLSFRLDHCVCVCIWTPLLNTTLSSFSASQHLNHQFLSTQLRFLFSFLLSLPSLPPFPFRLSCCLAQTEPQEIHSNPTVPLASRPLLYSAGNNDQTTHFFLFLGRPCRPCRPCRPARQQQAGSHGQENMWRGLPSSCAHAYAGGLRWRCRMGPRGSRYAPTVSEPA